ncbi:hypothetical protein OPV22_000996 [Ensete ventricosum]|uniref:Uncharacterized protein n=1 Tax=Ensete ventricosum TaxID=4639 RepID=A0AAV8RVX2_ENSVE|nr:hypothetical protein OPV22_000996 [Ensete ventricosum]
MSKAWGAVGAWALDAERAEAEERERPAGETPPASPLLASETAEGFPTLKEAASSSKQKKKKKKPVPLAQFVAGGGPRDPSFESKRLTPDEMLGLPTGPRERSQDELGYGRLGGGFRSYGDGGGPRRSLPGRRVDEGDGSWGGAGGGRRSYGGFDEEPRKGPPDRYSDFDQPSRADEVDNWGAGKKPFAPPLADAGRRDSYSFSGGGSSSRADEVDSWSTAKKPLPSDNPSFGSGFGDSRASSDSYGWGRSREGSIPLDQGRPKIVLDPPKRNVGTPSEPVRSRPSPFGAARPREEVLAQKGLDWRQMDSENEMKKTSRPTSSHSSRPSSAHSSRPVSPGLQSAAVAAEVAVKPRPKVNPFGDAKPREVLLQEKGIDWKKIDLEVEYRNVERSVSNEEKMLKEKINYLKSLARETEGDLNGKFKKLSAEELSKLHEEIARKEKDLELLVHQFDEKVQVGQRTTANIRPGSGSGRSDTSSTRPPSQSGMSEGSRSIDFVDRPQSGGGTGDAWGKHVDDRRGFQGRRDKSFFESRNADRSSSRERW